MAIFSSRPAQGGRPDPARRGEPAGLTIIAAGTTIVGDVGSEGVVKVEGTVQGTVRAATQLLVAPGALIRGDVFAPEIVAGGEIHGSVHADERAEIQAGAIVEGDIQTQRLHIAEGGRVNGQISMEPNAGERGQGERESMSAGTQSTPS
jgi:cytoskeletal protein CcmA (bactofilin family)